MRIASPKAVASVRATNWSSKLLHQMNALRPPKESSGTDPKKGGQRIQRSGQIGHFDHVPIVAIWLKENIFFAM